MRITNNCTTKKTATQSFMNSTNNFTKRPVNYIFQIRLVS